MQPIENWNDIQPTQGGAKTLGPGGYICRILRVGDRTREDKPHLDVVYDVLTADGKGYHFADIANDGEQDWRHTFKVYTGKGMGQLRMLAQCCEQTPENGGFRYDPTRDGHEQQLVGKWVGFVIGQRIYQNGNGEDKEALDLVKILPVPDIQAGKFEVPAAPRDTRTPQQKAASARKAAQAARQPGAAQQAAYDDEIPF